jgi:nucleoside-diphosphate-sugar epimerase
MVLVVGATGLVGSEVCGKLARRAEKVRALVRANQLEGQDSGSAGIGRRIMRWRPKRPRLGRSGLPRCGCGDLDCVRDIVPPARRFH